MDLELKKKKIITAVAVCLLLAVYIMIFSFSADDAAASSTISVEVTRKLMKLYYHLFSSGNQGAVIVPAVSDEAEAIVRKLAHFTEYMAMGFLSFGIVIMWIRRIHKGVLVVVLQVFVSATADEFHQYFVPGRYASFRDVMIDTAGGVAGIILIILMKRIKNRWNRRR